VDGRRFWHLDKAFRGACRRARVADVRWHDLRRTCGCRLLQDRGFSMEQVRTWLGHSDLKTTQRSYAFLDVSHLVRAIVESQPRVAALDLGRTVARPRNHLCRTHW
jgi:integrase